jgi:hypothetical protein
MTGREIRRGTMLDEFRIVSLPTWVGKLQVRRKPLLQRLPLEFQR